jgi:hypothetical protein
MRHEQRDAVHAWPGEEDQQVVIMQACMSMNQDVRYVVQSCRTALHTPAHASKHTPNISSDMLLLRSEVRVRQPAVDVAVGQYGPAG